MPPRRGRPRKRNQRIDAAIDHFTPFGYTERDIRAAVADLLKVYGDEDAWCLLEADCYSVVLNKLLEMEDEEKEKQKQKQDQLLLLEHQQAEDEPPQVHNEVPVRTAADEELEDPMFMEAPALESLAPLRAAIRTGYTRRPCYGWLSESEDEEEEQPTGQQHEVHVPSAEEGLLCKRMQVQ